MRNKIKEILKYIVTFLGVILVFNVLLYLASIIPIKAIEKNSIKSAQIMNSEELFQHKGFFSFIDNNSDVLVINEAYSIDPEDPVKSYMLARKNYRKGQTKIELGDQNGMLETYSQNIINESGEAVPDDMYDIAAEFSNFVSGDVQISQSYSRYYHGFLVIMRPLLMLFDVNGIRQFMVVVFFIILCVFDYFMYKKLGNKNTIIFTILLVIFGYFSIAQSIQSAPYMLAMMLSLIFLLVKIDKFTINYLKYYLFIVGMISCFIDFLTIPVLSLTFALVFVYLYNNMNQNCLNLKGKDFKEDFINIIILGLIWSAGYVLTWASKAILVSLLYNNGGLLSFFNQILYRVSGDISDYSERLIKDIQFGAIIVVETIIICLVLFRFICDYKPKKMDKKLIAENYNLVLAGLIPVVWMILTNNHTVYHFNLFSYRNMIGPFLMYYLIRYGDVGEVFKVKKKKQNK
jgi:hypothetical protein